MAIIDHLTDLTLDVTIIPILLELLHMYVIFQLSSSGVETEQRWITQSISSYKMKNKIRIIITPFAIFLLSTQVFTVISWSNSR